MGFDVRMKKAANNIRRETRIYPVNIFIKNVKLSFVQKQYRTWLKTIRYFDLPALITDADTQTHAYQFGSNPKLLIHTRIAQNHSYSWTKYYNALWNCGHSSIHHIDYNLRRCIETIKQV